MTAALVDIFCRSFASPPPAITLDIDDTCDRVHGHQQLSLFHAHYDNRGREQRSGAGGCRAGWIAGDAEGQRRGCRVIE